MSSGTTVERLLRRDRSLTAAFLALLALLAWIYVACGAGMGAPSLSATLFPHKAAQLGHTGMVGMAGMESAADWTPQDWLLAVAMWWTMMVAMMTPAAAPTILLYARVRQGVAARGPGSAGLASTGVFALTYLVIWLGFAVLATLVHWAFATTGLVSGASMGSVSRWLSASVLFAAGLYQLSPLKHACLTTCRAPVAFLTRNWRPGRFAAVRLGALHGAYCIGCCGILMGLLFIGGVMNLVWIALLTLLVLAEKLSPAGLVIGRVSGVLLCVWGLATAIL